MVKLRKGKRERHHSKLAPPFLSLACSGKGRLLINVATVLEVLIEFCSNTYTPSISYLVLVTSVIYISVRAHNNARKTNELIKTRHAYLEVVDFGNCQS